MNDSSQASGPDFLKRLWSRWPLALCVFAALFACVAANILSTPVKYRSTLKIVARNDHSESQINTAIQLLTGSKVLGEVAKSLHLEDGVALEGAPEVRQEAAVRDLQKDLVVKAVLNSNVIEISYISTDAQWSTDVLNAIWRSYNLVNRRMDGAPGSLGYFERLSAEYDDQLTEAQAALSKFRTDHGITTIPADLERSAAVSTRLKQETKSPKLDRSSDEAEIQKLSSLLVALQGKRYEWAMHYRPGDASPVELDAEIAHAKELLAQAKQSSEESFVVNSPADAAHGDHLRTPVSNTAQAQTEDSPAGLSIVDSVEYKQLMRKFSDIQELDQSYHKKVQEASLEQSQDQQPVSNLAIVDEPFTSKKPVSPRRGLLLALGFLCSVLLAWITVAVVEVLIPHFEMGFLSSSRPMVSAASPRSSSRSSSKTASKTASKDRSAHSVSQPARSASHRSPAPGIVISAHDPLPFTVQVKDETLEHILSPVEEPVTTQPALEVSSNISPQPALEQVVLSPAALIPTQAPSPSVPEPLAISAPVSLPLPVRQPVSSASQMIPAIVIPAPDPLPLAIQSKDETPGQIITPVEVVPVTTRPAFEVCSNISLQPVAEHVVPSPVAHTEIQAPRQSVSEPLAISTPASLPLPMSQPVPLVTHLSAAPAIETTAHGLQPLVAQVERKSFEQIINLVKAAPETVRFAFNNGNHNRPEPPAEQVQLLPIAHAQMEQPRRSVPEPLVVSVPIRSPIELGATIDVPLLANISAASLPPVSNNFSVLYLSVQRVKVAQSEGVRR